jgi:predicted phosphodiesterase
MATAPPPCAKTTVQYVSDLHLEIVKEKWWGRLLELYLQPVPGARVLVLAGDIGSDANGSLQAALARASRLWEHVVYVMGNHEYYKVPEDRTRSRPRPFEEVEAGVRKVVAALPNVHLLMHDTPVWRLPESKVVFVGSTLWTNLKGQRELLHTIRDFRETATTMDQTTARWERDKKVIASELRALGVVDGLEDDDGEDDDGKVVVVTHHMPSMALIAPEFKDGGSNAAFASDCEWLMPGVNAWIYGHTHRSGSAVINGCLCVANPVGYPDEDSKFNCAAVLSV